MTDGQARKSMKITDLTLDAWDYNTGPVTKGGHADSSGKMLVGFAVTVGACMLIGTGAYAVNVKMSKQAPKMSAAAATAPDVSEPRDAPPVQTPPPAEEPPAPPALPPTAAAKDDAAEPAAPVEAAPKVAAAPSPLTKKTRPATKAKAKKATVRKRKASKRKARVAKKTKAKPKLAKRKAAAPAPKAAPPPAKSAVTTVAQAPAQATPAKTSPAKLTSVLLKRAITAQLGAAASCMNTNIKRPKRGGGLLVDHCPSYKTVDGAQSLTMKVAPSGEILSVRFKNAAVNKSKIGACIVRSMKAWSFPAFESDEPVVLKQRVSFEPCVPINGKCVF